MKKLVVLSIVAALAVIGCKKEEAKEEIHIPSDVAIKVGSSVNLGYVKPWQSSRGFVATVTGEGLIEGKHVGTCRVSCDEAYCNVTVNPTITLFRDPVLEWGCSRDYIRNIEGEPTTDNDNGITYKDNSSCAPIRMYLFGDNGLRSAAILIDIDKAGAEYVTDHILERYNAFGMSGDMFVFADGETSNDATVVVGFYPYKTTGYWVLMYTPNNSHKTSARSRIEALMEH